MKTITIEVTEEDISTGKREKCFNCPVALAMARHLGQLVKIGSFTWKIAGHEPFTLPHKAQRFISSFDNEGPESVCPFTFTVEVPCPDSSR